MLKLKNIFLATFILLAVLAITIPNTTYAASSSVGVVNYQQLINQYPDMANETYKAAFKQVQDEYKEK